MSVRPPPTQKTATTTCTTLKTEYQSLYQPEVRAKIVPTARTPTPSAIVSGADERPFAGRCRRMWFPCPGVKATGRTATRPRAPPRGSRRSRAPRDVSYAPAPRGRRRRVPIRKADRSETSFRPRKSKATSKPRVASPFQSESSGKSRSSACIHATCVHGESREIAYGCTPAARNSSLLSRRSSISFVQVDDQSKR